jgi:hypothetical protein
VQWLRSAQGEVPVVQRNRNISVVVAVGNKEIEKASK